MRLVVKCGGAAGVDHRRIAGDIAELVDEGHEVVLVHGGSDATDRLGRQLGREPRYLTSLSGAVSRYTDGATLDVLTMALRGRVQPRLLIALNRLGTRAVGLSGVDGRLVEARRKPALKAFVDGVPTVVRDDLSGRVVRVDARLLEALLQLGYVPVVCPPAWDPQSGAVNVDADRLAAAMAGAVGADALLFLSNVKGLLRDPADEASVIPRLDPDGLARVERFARGRMRLKLIATREALEHGVFEVVIADGRGERPVRAALEGGGTLVRREAEPAGVR
jgi:acetylglutamate/LysW-gamma-L-alpha-aminoadipate kinase